VAFGLYQLGEGERFIGQDLLPKLIQLPFVYISESGSLPVSVYQELSKGAAVSFEKYPIRYYIFRSDIKGAADDVTTPPKSFKLVFQNNLFRLYENPSALPLLQTQNNLPVTFEKVSPVEYRIMLKGLQAPEKLFFHENYSKDWKLFPGRKERSSLSYFWNKEVLNDTHTRGESFFNAWVIDPASLKQTFPKDAYKENPDGSMDVELTLYFKPQAYLYLGLIVSSLTLLGYLAYLWYARRKRRRKSVIIQ